MMMITNQETPIKNGLVLPYATKDTPLVKTLTLSTQADDFCVWEACNLESETLNKILKIVCSSGNSATKRLIKYLATTSDPRERITVKCNRACAVGNIGDTAAKVNPRLYPFGLQIACEQPKKFSLGKPLNQFGEPTQQYVWSLYRLKDAANDNNAQGGK